MSKSIHQLIGDCPVIPVLEVENTNDALPLAEALVSGGLNVLEVTLRTDAALKVIEIMSEVENAVVVAGTIVTPEDMNNARQAGAKFAVSPGSTNELLRSASDLDFPFMPGVSTASEAMQAYSKGYQFLKFFPAESSGGMNALKSFSGPLKQIKFCPTGGISFDNAAQYLALPNVVCVGGSWVANKSMIASGDWNGIQQLAREAKNAFSNPS